MKHIYVAGPITQGDQLHNIAEAMRAGNRLIAAGYAPFIPHLFSFLHMHQAQDYEAWMRLDFAWLERCDALVRLPGPSSGSDREVARALEKGIPVYFGIEEFFAAEKAA